MATFLWIMGVAVVLIAAFTLARFWRRTTAPRLITCPENNAYQTVEVDAAHRLGQFVRGKDEMHLCDCTRWPEKQDCGQSCLEQIAAAPDGCRVRSLLDGFYAGQSCVLCGKEFDETVDWYDHEPAFIDAERQVMSWQDIPSERLPEIMEDHFPVCWDCKVIESVRQKHPSRITDRLAH
jgi:hypothetical protein